MWFVESDADRPRANRFRWHPIPEKLSIRPRPSSEHPRIGSEFGRCCGHWYLLSSALYIFVELMIKNLNRIVKHGSCDEPFTLYFHWNSKFEKKNLIEHCNVQLMKHRNELQNFGSLLNTYIYIEPDNLLNLPSISILSIPFIVCGDFKFVSVCNQKSIYFHNTICTKYSLRIWLQFSSVRCAFVWIYLILNWF